MRPLCIWCERRPAMRPFQGVDPLYCRRCCRAVLDAYDADAAVAVRLDNPTTRDDETRRIVRDAGLLSDLS
jgi:hypothetical protein